MKTLNGLKAKNRKGLAPSVISFGMAAVAVAVLSAQARAASIFAASFELGGNQYQGTVTITQAVARPPCSTSYRGYMQVALLGRFPVAGSRKVCGWVGPAPVEGYYVFLPDGQTAPLVLIP